MATQTNTLKTTATPAKAKAAPKKKASAPVVKPARVKTAKAKTETVENKRITPGTPIKEYRIRKSQRKAVSGYFVQGGEYRMVGNENQFFVAIEELHTDLKMAKNALEKITSKTAKASK